MKPTREIADEGRIHLRTRWEEQELDGRYHHRDEAEMYQRMKRLQHL